MWWQRTDEFGGSLENRYRLLDSVVSAVKTVYPADRIGVRISPQGKEALVYFLIVRS
jgi:2,4-dienoyl-CoA reductase-like NADH-dependent reductase (Old Yellow Enzyme family)